MSLASQTFFLSCDISSLPDPSFALHVLQATGSWGLDLGTRLQHTTFLVIFVEEGVGEGGEEEKRDEEREGGKEEGIDEEREGGKEEGIDEEREGGKEEGRDEEREGWKEEGRDEEWKGGTTYKQQCHVRRLQGVRYRVTLIVTA